jgi:hypothetical protein
LFCNKNPLAFQYLQNFVVFLKNSIPGTIPASLPIRRGKRILERGGMLVKCRIVRDYRTLNQVELETINRWIGIFPQTSRISRADNNNISVRIRRTRRQPFSRHIWSIKCQSRTSATNMESSRSKSTTGRKSSSKTRRPPFSRWPSVRPRNVTRTRASSIPCL